MSTRRLKGFGWFALGALIAPPCYLVTSEVGQSRAEVEAVERAIVQTRKEIRALETEFTTRANYAQLQRWNGDVLAYAAPRAEQFLPNDLALASLGRPAGDRAPTRYAALVIPRGTPDVTAQSAPDPAPAAEAAATTKADTARVARTASAVATRSPGEATPLTTARAVAMLDRQILSEATLGDLARGARAEASGLR